MPVILDRARLIPAFVLHFLSLIITMPARRRSPSTRLAQQTLELSLAAPQVVAHRLTRMALAGPRPSAADSREFNLMGTEKILAFQQSWAAMWMQMWQAQFKVAEAMGQATMKTMAAGMTPVHSKAVANARRLARKRK